MAQATEQQLYDLFAPIGEILELYILRNSNGKSRGCAFVTYANKFLAQQAITQLNGKQVRTVPSSRHLRSHMVVPLALAADTSVAGVCWETHDDEEVNAEQRSICFERGIKSRKEFGQFHAELHKLF